VSVENLFDNLAELRWAATASTEFVQLPAPDQADFIQKARTRLEAPPEDAPAVCHLDTGVNQGHPLIAPVLSPDHVLTVDPGWTSADTHGHGTEMAGLALYGNLVEVFENNDPVILRHRLESVTHINLTV
jgi:hypothetical protein